MAIQMEHYPNLDGWRGVSILLVLITHLIPLGPDNWKLDDITGLLGMAIFFTLSGFLITSFLLKRHSTQEFVIRRFSRIIPLAWLYLLVALWWASAPLEAYLPHFLFYANWSPMPLTYTTEHIWSLCLEMQFYVSVTLLFYFFQQRGLLLLPILAIIITIIRISNHVYSDIHTYYRIDEIFAGCILALIYHNKLGKFLPKVLSSINQLLLIVLVLLACHPIGDFMNYFRPYIVAMLVGSTLYQSQSFLNPYLNLKILLYLASISYALYVIHPILLYTWLGEGDFIVKALKRFPLLLILFALAHISTFYYEHKWIALGKKMSKRFSNH